ncbi:MAG: hypothetical protein ACLQFW_15965 [Xanthobacteraceae bacterium]
MTDSDERLLLAKITHLERTLRVREVECQRLRAQVRMLQPPETFKTVPVRDNIQHNNGAEK